MSRVHRETHAVERIGWLRASILGANDGIVSTASLIAGVAAAGTAQSSVLVTGVAGLVAGAGFADFGNDVACVDVDAGKIARLLAEHPPMPGSGEPRVMSVRCDMAYGWPAMKCHWP